jgi:uncharacterized 2Fe-2S/4Fe-4S cluster protein (DUF4445 family)
MGVRLTDECGGRGECDSCAVTVVRGAEILSAVTDAERKQLSDDRRNAGERLACQVKVERSGELVLRIAPEVVKAEENSAKFRKAFGKLDLAPKMAFVMEFERAVLGRKPVAIKGDEAEAQYRRDFNELAFDKKLLAIAELEGAAAIHGLVGVANLPFTIGEKVMDLMAKRGHRMNQAEQAGASAQEPVNDRKDS